MLNKIIKNDQILLDLKGTTKDEIIDEFVDVFLSSGIIKDREAVKKALIDRETTMTTALGKNVAVPHTKTSEVSDLQLAIGIHRKGVDFDAPDGLPVNIFFVLLSPLNTSGPHIQCLANIARTLDREKLRKLLLSCKSPQDIIDAVKNNVTV